VNKLTSILKNEIEKRELNLAIFHSTKTLLVFVTPEKTGFS